MSIHSTGNREQVQTYQEPPTVYASDGNGNQQSNNYDVFSPPPSSGSGQQAVHTLRIVLLLLAIVCLGSLGAVPLATNFLPANFVTPPATPTHVAVRPTPTPLPTMPGGECTATPQKMNYASTGPTPPRGKKVTPTPTPMLPSEWSNSGHTQQDFGNVQACAASFVVTYETIDANDFRTLEASTEMFSSGAKLRFYGRLPGSKADNRMDPLWRAVIQKQNLKQTAQVTVPSLLSARYSDKHLYVWMLVSYHLSIERNGQTLGLDSQRTVLLVDMVTQAGGSGTGWQVSEWRDGDVPFAIPNPV